MIQWIGVAIAVLGFVWNSVKDYQKGDIKLPVIQHKAEVKKIQYPIQYCLMAYDPNVDKVFYQHENGQWYEFPPQQRRYSTQAETNNQNQTQKPVGVAYGTSGGSGQYYVR